MKVRSILVGIGGVLVLGIFQFLSKDKINTYTNRLMVGNNVFKIEIASTPHSRAAGLSGRDNLPSDAGMLFIFEDKNRYGFWMKGMKFPLDLIWIEGDKIKGFTENIPPPINPFNLNIYYPPQPVDKVLELNAGSVKKYNLKIGDKINLLANQPTERNE